MAMTVEQRALRLQAAKENVIAALDTIHQDGRSGVNRYGVQWTIWENTGAKRDGFPDFYIVHQALRSLIDEGKVSTATVKDPYYKSITIYHFAKDPASFPWRHETKPKTTTSAKGK
jgi:allantoicase